MDTKFIISVIVIMALALLMALLLLGVNALANPRPSRERKSEPQPEPEPQHESVAEPEPVQEPSPESLPEPEPLSEPESLPKPEIEEEPEQELVFDSEPEPEPEIEPEPEPAPVPEPVQEPLAEPVPEPEPQVVSEPESEPEPVPEPVPESESDPETEQSNIFTGEVISNHNVGKYYKELRVRIPEGRNFRFRSGEYMNIHAPAGTVDFSSMEIDKRFQWDWKEEKLYELNVINPEEVLREYTILSYPGERVEGDEGSTVVKFLVRLALPETEGVQPGVCSSYIFSLKPGDKVRLSGPYGETLMLKDVPHERELVFICGGAGISMMRSYVLSLLRGDKSTRKICCYYGTDVYADAFYISEFRALEREFPSFRFRLVLEIPDMEAIMNGVDFDQGYVHQAVYVNYLKTHKSPQLPLYFVCGPQDMVAATRDMLSSLNVPVENIIGDGFSEEE